MWKMKDSAIDRITLQLKDGSCYKIIRRIYFLSGHRENTQIERRMLRSLQTVVLISQSCSLIEDLKEISTLSNQLKLHIRIMPR